MSNGETLQLPSADCPQEGNGSSISGVGKTYRLLIKLPVRGGQPLPRNWTVGRIRLDKRRDDTWTTEVSLKGTFGRNVKVIEHGGATANTPLSLLHDLLRNQLRLAMLTWSQTHGDSQ